MTKPGAVTDIKPKAQVAARSANDHELARRRRARTRTRSRWRASTRSTATALRSGASLCASASTSSRRRASRQAHEPRCGGRGRLRGDAREGLSVLYVGTATFKGVDCTSSDRALRLRQAPEDGEVPLRLQDADHVRELPEHGSPRQGVRRRRGAARCPGERARGTVAQITLHVDHPFWNTVDHDAAELYFDQMAAVASPDGTLVDRRSREARLHELQGPRRQGAPLAFVRRRQAGEDAAFAGSTRAAFRSTRRPRPSPRSATTPTTSPTSRAPGPPQRRRTLRDRARVRRAALKCLES